MKRVIRAEERRLWRAAMRDVRRRKPDAPEDEPESVIEKLPLLPAPPAIVPRRKVSTSFSPIVPGALDGETTRRLKIKAMRPQARLDLHGMTEAAAHNALNDFIEQCTAKNHSLVLVITGKGRAGQGVLRRNLPLWLETAHLRTKIIAYAPAFISDGGGGAFYLHLRRRD